MAVKKTSTVTINAPEFEVVEFKIVGDTPLIVHAWDEKAKRMVRFGYAGQVRSGLGRRGGVRLCKAVQGLAWHGQAGKVRHGPVRHGRASPCGVWQSRFGSAWSA